MLSVRPEPTSVSAPTPEPTFIPAPKSMPVETSESLGNQMFSSAILALRSVNASFLMWDMVGKTLLAVPEELRANLAQTIQDRQDAQSTLYWAWTLLTAWAEMLALACVSAARLDMIHGLLWGCTGLFNEHAVRWVLPVW